MFSLLLVTVKTSSLCCFLFSINLFKHFSLLTWTFSLLGTRFMLHSNAMQRQETMMTGPEVGDQECLQREKTECWPERLYRTSGWQFQTWQHLGVQQLLLLQKQLFVDDCKTRVSMATWQLRSHCLPLDIDVYILSLPENICIGTGLIGRLFSGQMRVVSQWSKATMRSFV